VKRPRTPIEQDFEGCRELLQRSFKRFDVTRSIATKVKNRALPWAYVSELPRHRFVDFLPVRVLRITQGTIRWDGPPIAYWPGLVQTLLAGRFM